MRKWMSVITVVGLLLLTVSTGWGDGRHRGRWWDTPEYVAALNLTQIEIQELNQGYEASSLSMIELKSRVEAERFKLNAVLEKEVLDTAAIEEQYTRLEQARADLSKARFEFFIQVRKIIGPQRFHQLMEIYQERRSHRK